MRIWRLHDYLFVKSAASKRATGGPRDTYWDAQFLSLGEIVAELNRVPGSLCERKRMRGLPFGARLAGRVQLSRLRRWPSLASPSRSPAEAFRT
jgi:hypothetical protein